MAREGIEYSQQYPTCGYYLDFATFPDGKKLNIEVDGEKYHRDRYGNLRAEDIRRDLILKADGWFVQRFWVYELREDMKKCIRKIKSLME
jgi:very-short-patch-repair endonuclease